jgi:hypothetical protein
MIDEEYQILGVKYCLQEHFQKHLKDESKSLRLICHLND